MIPARAILMLLAVVATATPAQQADEAARDEFGFDVEFDESLPLPSDEGSASPAASAWLAYGLMRGRVYQDLQIRGTANQSGDDFAIEHSARLALATVWRELKASGAAGADEYLDALVRIADAGFVDEYVTFVFGKPGWTIPAETLSGLDPEAFLRFFNDGFANMGNPTLAMAVPRAHPVFPDAPGSALPDPASLTPAEMPCDRSMEILNSALRDWDDEAARLDGAAIAAASSGEFLLHVLAAATSEPLRSRGATWVNPRAAEVAFMSGYCAIELSDFDLAEEALTIAAGLQPANASIKSELAHAYLANGKLDEADRIVESMIEITDDRCDLGYAWRRRGYIRFEQGRLDEARAAYIKSLDYDPSSELARSELELLDAEIVEHGGEPPEYVPPDIVTTTTRCGN